MPDGIVPVRVDENDRLPGPEGETPVDNRNDRRRCNESRHDMIGTVAGRSVPVPVATIISRKNLVDGVHQILIAAGSGLDDRYTGRGMRYEDVEEAVAPSRNESCHLGGDIERSPTPARLDGENRGVQGSDVLALEDLAHRRVCEDRVHGACQDRSNRENGHLVHRQGLGGHGERVRDDEFIDLGLGDPFERRR